MTLKKSILFFMTFILAISSYSFQVSQRQVEDNLKAAFLYGFLDYIEWNNKNGEPLDIAVLGESAVYQYLLDISRDKSRSRVINVRRVRHVNEVGNSQVVFISRYYKHSKQAAIARLDKKPVLIVSEVKGDLDKGSHINFILYNNKLQFEINLRKATESGFKIGSQLLKHALVIKR